MSFKFLEIRLPQHKQGQTLLPLMLQPFVGAIFASSNHPSQFHDGEPWRLPLLNPSVAIRRFLPKAGIRLFPRDQWFQTMPRKHPLTWIYNWCRQNTNPDVGMSAELSQKWHRILVRCSGNSDIVHPWVMTRYRQPSDDLCIICIIFHAKLTLDLRKLRKLTEEPGWLGIEQSLGNFLWENKSTSLLWGWNMVSTIKVALLSVFNSPYLKRLRVPTVQVRSRDGCHCDREPKALSESMSQVLSSKTSMPI